MYCVVCVATKSCLLYCYVSFRIKCIVVQLIGSKLPWNTIVLYLVIIVVCSVIITDCSAYVLLMFQLQNMSKSAATQVATKFQKDAVFR